MSYTVKQIADVLQVSKPTVRKYLSKLSEADRSGNSTDGITGALIISEECYKALIERYRAENGAETLAERQRKADGNTENEFSETLRKQIETLENTVETLEKHIEKLYKQLEVKDDQIKQLNVLLSQQQAIHMKQLETLPNDQNEPEQKHGFFKRIFRRK